MHQFESRICRVRISVGSLGVHTLITYGLPLIQFASVLIHVGSPSVSKLVPVQVQRATVVQVAESRLKMPAKHIPVRNNTKH